MGKVLGRPKFSDGDREKLRAAVNGGKSWHAVSNRDTDSLQHDQEAHPYARVRNAAPRCNVERDSKTSARLRADPSALLLRRSPSENRGSG
jgi:hypothetical protein